MRGQKRLRGDRPPLLREHAAVEQQWLGETIDAAQQRTHRHDLHGVVVPAVLEEHFPCDRVLQPVVHAYHVVLLLLLADGQHAHLAGTVLQAAHHQPVVHLIVQHVVVVDLLHLLITPAANPALVDVVLEVQLLLGLVYEHHGWQQLYQVRLRLIAVAVHQVAVVEVVLRVDGDMNPAETVVLSVVHVWDAQPISPDPRGFASQADVHMVLILLALLVVEVKVVHHREWERRVVNWRGIAVLWVFHVVQVAQQRRRGGRHSVALSRLVAQLHFDGRRQQRQHAHRREERHRRLQERVLHRQEDRLVALLCVRAVARLQIELDALFLLQREGVDVDTLGPRARLACARALLLCCQCEAYDGRVVVQCRRQLVAVGNGRASTSQQHSEYAPRQGHHLVGEQLRHEEVEAGVVDEEDAIAAAAHGTAVLFRRHAAPCVQIAVGQVAQQQQAVRVDDGFDG